MNEIDPVILQLIVDGKEQYKADLRDATKAVEQETDKQADAVEDLEKRNSGALQKMGAAFSQIGQALALAGVSITAVAAGLIAVIARTVAFAQNIEATSQKLGITTEAFQELSFAHTQLGGDQAALEQGMESLNEKLQKAALGAEDEAKLFKVLGIEIEGAKGKVKNASEILPALADRINAIDDPMRRAAIRAEYFGDAAAEMGKLLDVGGQGINELAQRAHELGVVLSDEDIQRLVRAGEAVKRLRAQLEIRMTRAVGENAAAIEGLANSFADLTDRVLGAIGVLQRWNAIRILRNGVGTDADRAGAIGALGTSQAGRREAFESVRQRRRFALEKYRGDEAAIAEVNRQAAEDYRRIIAAGQRREAAKLPVDPTNPIVSGLLAPDGRKPRGRGGKKGRSGPTVEEIEQQHAEALRELYVEQLQDELEVTRDNDRRREILAELDRIEYEQRKAKIENDKNFSAAEKAAQIKALDEIYGPSRTINGEIVIGKPTFRGQARNLEEQERAARDRAQAASNEAAALQAEAELADTRIARLAIEREILKQREIEEEAALEAAIASGQIADATQARATLEREQAARREKTGRDFESPFQSYARRLRNRGDNIGDEVQELVVQRLDEVDDAIAEAVTDRLGIKDPLLKRLFALFIEQVWMRPMAEALASAGGAGTGAGGAGGILGGVFSALGTVFNPFGRASGGYVAPHSIHRVNEHKGGVELLRMGSQGGQVMSLGEANARAARPTGNTVVLAPRYDLKGAVLTPQLLAEMERRNQESIQRAAPYIADAGANLALKKQANMRRFGST